MLLFLAQVPDPGQVEKYQLLIEKGPLSILCLLLIAGIVFFVRLWVRARGRIEALQEHHKDEMGAIRDKHAAELAERNEQDRKRSIRLEQTLTGFVRMAERMESERRAADLAGKMESERIADEMAERERLAYGEPRKKKRTSSPKMTMPAPEPLLEPESPTVIHSLKPEPGDGE